MSNKLKQLPIVDLDGSHCVQRCRRESIDGTTMMLMMMMMMMMMMMKLMTICGCICQYVHIDVCTYTDTSNLS